SGHAVVRGKVERHDIGGVGEQADQRRRLAHLGLHRRAELAEQSLIDQAAYEVGDGYPGQAGGAGEIGPGGGTVREELLQDQRPVVSPGVLGEQLADGAQRATAGAVSVHLTAPAVRPLTTRRSMKANRMTTGTVATRPPAKR